MIKDILQQLAPLDEKIAALRGDPADENMTDITNHAAELAELSAQEDALLSGCGALTAEDRVFLARHPERPHIDEIVDALFTDFFEQCGDRQCKEDAAILGGVALFHGQPVTVIGHRKGGTLEENLRCNFGMPGPEGYRKALRLMKQAEKFDRPIITFIDTPGAYPGKDAEERGQGEAIARNLMEMSGLTVPVIAVVTGEGSSGGALALGVANRILMLENAVYSVLSPEGFASILWKDSSRSGEACEIMKLTAQDLYKDGIVEEIIPEALKQNVAVKTFPDLNALILSGDRRDVARVETFLRSVDKPVPMVTMEILIADVTKSRIHEIGLGAGVGDKAVKTSGTLSPGVDMTFSSGAVNDLLGRIRGTVNLGRVTPNFYLSLQALEEDGVVRLLSTPKLSTLNGHEATLTSGETQYYKEVQNNYYGTQNPISSESYQWKSVDANLSIKVTPYVSEDRQITLEIEFEQTEFTDRNVEDAPPGTATRSFKSIVKVQNEEMVLLGGLDRNTMENSSRGVPFLARVPVIKWFFGKEKRNKVERTLNIFIKPTVVE